VPGQQHSSADHHAEIYFTPGVPSNLLSSDIQQSI